LCKRYANWDALRFDYSCYRLVPATGKEAAIARSYPEIDRVQAPEHFWRFYCGVIRQKTGTGAIAVFYSWRRSVPQSWQTSGYRTVVYAEWSARWQRWIDRFGVMNPEMISRVPQKYAHKFAVVGV